MYVVPFTVLRHFVGNVAEPLDQTEPSGSVTVSAGLFMRLLQAALQTHAFDEDAYLVANPDVASSIRRGEFSSGRQHFVERGYFEGRGSLRDEFDEAWYVKVNPDVARSIRAGTYPSGRAHFLEAGAFEFRAPNSDSETDMNLWRTSLNPVPERKPALAEQ